MAGAFLFRSFAFAQGLEQKMKNFTKMWLTPLSWGMAGSYNIFPVRNQLTYQVGLKLVQIRVFSVTEISHMKLRH